MRAMIAAAAFALTLCATTSPALAQEDGLSGGQIILVQDKPRTGAPKQKCETVKVRECTAAPDGKTTNCREFTETRCTVVSGPGAAKQ